MEVKPSVPKRVLVIRLQNHGDVLLTTPLFSTLKRIFPGVEIDALVFAETMPMLESNPDLSSILSLPRGKQAGRGWNRLRTFFSLMRKIRRRQYDWVLHLNDQWSGACAALISGASLRFGYEIQKRDYWIWRRVFPHRVTPTSTGHMVEQNMAVLESLGLPVKREDMQCTMCYSHADTAAVSSRLTPLGVTGPYILIHPTSRWFFKCWEDDRFAKVITYLADAGWKVVLTSSPDDRELELVKGLLQRVGVHSNVVSIAGQLSLPGLAAAIAGAALFIGVDSVPMHMAAALGVPIVALFGPTHVHIWRPWSKNAEVIHAADYGPLIAPNDVDTSTSDRYLSNIHVPPVLAAIDRQLLKITSIQNGVDVD